MSPMYEKIKFYYDVQLWNVTRVWNMVERNVLTEEEYFEITGFVYPLKS